jgi:hypothetical protein
MSTNSRDGCGALDPKDAQLRDGARRALIHALLAHMRVHTLSIPPR